MDSCNCAAKFDNTPPGIYPVGYQSYGVNNCYQYQLSLFAFWTQAYVMSILLQHPQAYLFRPGVSSHFLLNCADQLNKIFLLER